MDVGSFGTRRLANYVYAHRLTIAVEQATSQAETRLAEAGAGRARTLTDEERLEIQAETRRDFDRELEAGLAEDTQRLVRARDNTRAVRGLMEAMQRANEDAAV